MIAVRFSVPIACWRVGTAREYLESHELPPPATCYGALLSLVGEADREVHRGCRVTAGLLNEPGNAEVLRTLWRFKDAKTLQGNKENARPDFQQLRIQADIVVWVDSSDETREATLERRVRVAFREPGAVDRFGGLSLGESTHLINDAWLLEDSRPPGPCRAFLLDEHGSLTLPTWVDHVGSTGTRFAVGAIRTIESAPTFTTMPTIG
ncbi:MAG: type I-MYXAN CRISPR-associated protein Cas5/Cmx5/DevS [Phycisphaerales bacterium]|nr:type I-MYXAN CRISPR-associated protein Cas5/Cmx5/DevS [Phycisphaerales bacterium]